MQDGLLHQRGLREQPPPGDGAGREGGHVDQADEEARGGVEAAPVGLEARGREAPGGLSGPVLVDGGVLLMGVAVTRIAWLFRTMPALVF